MFRPCAKLLKIQLLQFYGINQAIHTKDNKKKVNAVLMGFSFLALSSMLVFYVAKGAWGLCLMGLSEIILAYLLAVSGLLILFFTLLKAGEVIFGSTAYEILFSLPVREEAIVASRFLSMYVGNAVMALLVMIPGIVVYGMFEKPGFLFYLAAFASVLAVPLVPMATATIIGTGILAIGSRMKHKNAVSVVLSLLVTFGCVVFFYSGDPAGGELDSILSTAAESINRMYPLASMYTKGLVEQKADSYALFLLLSIAFFAIVVAVIGKKYRSICEALHSHVARSNYRLTELEQKSPLKALYGREIRRYFASRMYVTNTLAGYLMMVLASLAIFVLDIERVESMLGMPGLLKSVLPFILAGMGSITSVSISSISMEGKQWWIVRSLPVSAKQLFDSKILVNLTISLPFTILAAVLAILSVPGQSFTCYLFLMLLPVLYQGFQAVLGIFINARLPVFDWENETYVVKQSGAVFLGILTGIASVIIPIVLLFAGRSALIGEEAVWAITFLVIAAVTFLLYLANNRMDLRKIG